MSATKKSIEISKHALERMKARQVSLNQLTGAIRKPTRRMAGNSPYTELIERDFPNGKVLAVVIEERPTIIRVVTTYWETHT